MSWKQLTLYLRNVLSCFPIVLQKEIAYYAMKTKEEIAKELFMLRDQMHRFEILCHTHLIDPDYKERGYCEEYLCDIPNCPIAFFNDWAHVEVHIFIRSKHFMTIRIVNKKIHAMIKDGDFWQNIEHPQKNGFWFQNVALRNAVRSRVRYYQLSHV